MAQLVKTATNHKTGERVALVGGNWVPITQTATNRKTGERVGLVNNQWVPIPPPSAPPKAEEKFKPSAIEEIPYVGSALSAVADVPLALGTGLATIGKTFSDTFGANNALSQGIDRFGKGAQELMSAEARADAAKDAEEMAKAQGFWESAGAAGRAFVRHPLETSANLLGTAAPFAAAAATGAGLPTLAAIGATSGVGMIKGDIYDAVSSRAKQAGLSDAQAHEIADKAQSYGGDNLDMIALGGVIGAVANATGAGPAVGKWIARTAAKDVAEQAAARAAASTAAGEVGEEVADKAAKGLLRRTAEGALVEGIPEGAQASQERLSQNLAQERAGFPTDTWKGVLEQGAYEGTLGAIFGGGIDAMAGHATPEDARAKRNAEDERQRRQVDASLGGVGDEYVRAVGRYKAAGLDEQTAMQRAGEDIREFVDSQRGKQNEEGGADTADGGGAGAGVSGRRRNGTRGTVGEAGEAELGPVGDGGATAAATVRDQGAEQPALSDEAKILTNPKIKKATRFSVAKQILSAAIRNNDIDPLDVSRNQFQQATQELADGKHNSDPVVALESVTGKKFGPTLDVNEAVAAPTAEPVVTGPTVEQAATAPVKQAIDAATQPAPGEAIPSLAEATARDLGIAEPAPAPAAEPAPAPAPTPTVEPVATPETGAEAAQAAPAPEMAPAPEPASEPTREEIMANPRMYGAQIAKQQGLDPGMFGEGLRDVIIGQEPLTDELILEKSGPDKLAAYKAGMELGASLTAAPEVAPAVEEAPAEAAPAVEEAPARALSPDEQAAADLIASVDAGGISFNTPKINDIARRLGLDVSRSAKPEDTIERIRAAVGRFAPEAAPDVNAAPEAAPAPAVEEAPVEAAPEAAPVVEEAPVEAAPEAAPEEAVDPYEEIADEVGSAYRFALDLGEEPEIDERAARLLERAIAERKVSPSDIRKELDKFRKNYSDRQLAQDEEGIRPKAKRGAAAGVDIKALAERIGKIVKNWRAKLDVKVIDSIDELPDALRDEVEAGDAQDSPAFVGPDGTIYVIASNMDSLEEASGIMYHEALGHLGLRALFNKRLDAVLRKIYDTNKAMRERADAWLKEHPDSYKGKENRELRALEEVLAEMSEAGQVKPDVWQKIVGLVKEFGRKIGMNIAYSDAEVRTILGMAHDQIVNGERQGTAIRGLRYMASRQGKQQGQPKVAPSIARMERNIASSTTASEMSGTVGDMFFRTRSGERQIEILSAAWKTIKDQTRRAIIGYLYYSRDVLRAVAKISPAIARQLGTVDQELHRANGTRNKMLRDLAYRVKAWDRFRIKFKEGGKILNNLFNMSTLYRVDVRNGTLQQVMAADVELQKLIKDGASAKRISNREETIKFIYNMWEQLGKPEMGSGEGQRIYRAVTKEFEESLENEVKAKISEIKQSGLPRESINAAIKGIMEMYEKAKVNVPYVPLFRSGDFWVSKGKGNNRDTKRYTSEVLYNLAINDAIKELQADGDKRSAAEIKADTTVLRFGRDIEGLKTHLLTKEPSSVLKNVLNEIDKGNLADAATIKDMVFQLYVASLPNETGLSHRQHRKGTAGFVSDVARAYVDTQTMTINRLTHLQHTHKVRRALGMAYALLAGNEDIQELQPYVDEMAMRVAETFNPKTSGYDTMARFANKATFLYLLTGVKSAMVQFFQLPTVALPVLGARYGYAKVAALAARNIATIGNKFGTSKYDADGNLVTNWGQPTMGDSKYINEHKDPEMREALKYGWEDARIRGILDTTFGGDMVDRKMRPSDEFRSAPAKIAGHVFNFVTGAMHHAERISREMAYMSAFELEYAKQRKSGVDSKTAMAIAADTAADLTLESMFDYAESSKPRSMKNPVGRVALQFYSFPIQMMSLVTRSFMGTLGLMSGTDRKIAAKQFFGLMGMLWMFAGTTGFPGYTFMMGILTSLKDAFGFGDDDDDDDDRNPLKAQNLDLWFREKFLPEYFGPDSSIAKSLGLSEKQAQTLTRAVKMGPVSAFSDLNFGSSASLDGLFFHDDTPVDSNEEALRSLSYSLLFGASGSVLRNLMRGSQYMMDGDWHRGIESMAPAFIKNPLVAQRLASEGYITPTTQDVVAPKEEYTWGKLVGQSMGLGRTSVNDIQKSNILAKKMVEGLEKERTDYSNKLNRVYRDIELGRISATEGQEQANKVWDDVEKWNKKTGYVHPLDYDNFIDSLYTRDVERAGSMEGLRVSQDYEPFIRDMLAKNR